MKLRDVVLAGIAAVGTIAAVAWLGFRGDAGDAGSKSADAYRACVVETALSHVGKRELATYTAAVAPEYVGTRPEWCGIFALWVLHTCGLAPGVKWLVGRGFLIPYKLPNTTDPKPGDIAYFTKYSHHAIIKAIRGDEVDCINGNGTGDVVTESTVALSSAAAFYSIQPWIDAAIERAAA